jgi:hypothetical protein
MSYGIEFAEFAVSVPEKLNNLLLLKHRFDEGDFNLHTLHEFVPADKVSKLIEEDVYGYGDFCWIDFEEVEGLNQLPGQELAELLYLSHLKEHLRLPFYNHLNNKYAYLAHDDGWFNKTYYRDMNAFYYMVGNVISSKMGEMKLEKSLLGFKKRKSFPVVPDEVIVPLKDMMKEGIVISLRHAEQNRSRIVIPIWLVGDYANMDDMYDAFEKEASNKCNAKLVFDKKVKQWRVYTHL